MLKIGESDQTRKKATLGIKGEKSGLHHHSGTGGSRGLGGQQKNKRLNVISKSQSFNREGGSLV